MRKLMPAIRRVWNEDTRANPVLKAALIVISKCYEALMRLRADLYHKGFRASKQLSCKVVSVGNITAGGTGKTPMTLYLARSLAESGLRPAIVSRGYKGALEAKGGVVSDGRKVLAGAADAGDEPFMMAKALPNVPVIVGADRYRAGRQAVSDFSPDVILLDDAFQHLKLKRDINLVLVDCSRPFGNGHVFPAGELREPLQALRRADAVILTRTDFENPSGKVKSADERLIGRIQCPVFRTRHVPEVRRIIRGGRSDTSNNTTGCNDEDIIRGQRIFAFSGVAKNDYFLYMLAGLKGRVVGNQAFPDHHKYLPADLQTVCRRAKELKVDFLVTTEKDLVKISTDVNWPVALIVMDIKISFGSDQKRFQSFLKQKLKL